MRCMSLSPRAAIMAALALCPIGMGSGALRSAENGGAVQTTDAGDPPRMGEGMAIPSVEEAGGGLSADLSPIQKRAGRNIRREAMLTRRILLAFIEAKKTMPGAAEVDAEVARVRAMPLEQVFGCCANGTFDEHLAQQYMTPDDFRESACVEIGLRRAAVEEWDVRVSATPAAKRKRLSELGDFPEKSARRVQALLFTVGAADGVPAASGILRQRAAAAAERLGEGEAWAMVARSADNVREGLPADGDLGLVPSWRPLAEDAGEYWRTLEPGAASKPLKALGGGWVILRWEKPGEDDLLEMARDEDVSTRLGQWRQAAEREAKAALAAR